MTTFQFSKLDVAVVKKSEKKTFEKLDNIKFTKILNEVNVDDILLCEDVDVAYSKLEDRILTAQQESTVVKTVKAPKIDNKWFDRELLKLRQKRQRFYNKFKNNRSLQNENAYKKNKFMLRKTCYKEEKRFFKWTSHKA